MDRDPARAQDQDREQAQAPAQAPSQPHVQAQSSSPVASLSDDLLEQLLLRVAASSCSSQAFRHSLACRRWHSLLRACLPSLCVRRDALLGEQELLRQLRSFPGLTSLKLPPRSVKTLTDDLLAGLGPFCPAISQLLILPDACALHPCSFTADGLFSLFSQSTNLTSLALLDRCSQSVHIPPSVSCLQQVQELSLGPAHYSHPFLTRSLPPSLGSLPCLRTLSFASFDLPTLPESISTLTSLEDLTINAPDLDPVPEFLSALSRLTSLSVTSFSRSPLPASVFLLPRLRRLDLQMCWLGVLPRELGLCRRLRELRISARRLVSLPATIGSLSSLRLLHITCGNLGMLPDDLSRLSRLRELALHPHLPGTLPHFVGSLASLTSLSMSKYVPRVDLMESIKGLGDLLSLRLVMCAPPTLGSLGIRPQDHQAHWDRGLRSLRQLHLNGSLIPEQLIDGFLNSFPLTLLSTLEELSLYSCWMPEGFEVCPGRLAALTSLEIAQPFPNTSSTRLPDSLVNLRSLRKWTLISCPNLSELPQNLAGTCHSSCECHMRRTNRRVAFINSSSPRPPGCSFSKGSEAGTPRGVASSASQEEPGGCCSSQCSPGMVALQELFLGHLDSLESLPESLGHLPALELLQVADCRQLQALPASMGCLGQLRRLRLCNLTRLGSIPASLGQLSGLQKLSLSGLDLVLGPLEGLSGLQGLEELIVEECWQLGELSPSLSSLGNLTSLSVAFCPALSSLPEDIGSLSGSLRRLHLKALDMLETLPLSVGELHSLRHLSLQSMPGLLSLPGSMSRLVGLWEVAIVACPVLGELPLLADTCVHLAEESQRDFRELEACIAQRKAKAQRVRGLRHLPHRQRLQKLARILPEG